MTQDEPSRPPAKPVRRAEQTGDSSTHDCFEVLARAGFVARGVVYAIIGILAFDLAPGDGGKITNQRAR